MEEAFALSVISQVGISVDNLDAAVSFYRDKLGLKLLFQAPPQMAFFECGGLRLLLGQRQPNQQTPDILLYFRVTDIREAHAALKGRGVRFDSEPHLVGRMPDREIWLAVFRDNENKLFHLISEVPKVAA